MITNILTERHILGLTLWSYIESSDKKSSVFSEVLKKNNSQIELLQSLAPKASLTRVTGNLRRYAETAPITPRTDKELMQLILDKEFEILRLTGELMNHPDTSFFVLRNLRLAARAHELFVEELTKKGVSTL